MSLAEQIIHGLKAFAEQLEAGELPQGTNVCRAGDVRCPACHEPWEGVPTRNRFLKTAGESHERNV